MTVLEVENAALRTELAECQARIAHLERQVADLTAAGAGRKATPQSSSLPASAAPKPAMAPKSRGGARKGRPGAFRRLAAEPDEVQEHRPEHCPNCGSAALADIAAELDFAHFPVTLGWLKTGRMAPRAIPALHVRTSAGGCR